MGSTDGIQPEGKIERLKSADDLLQCTEQISSSGDRSPHRLPDKGQSAPQLAVGMDGRPGFQACCP